MTAPTVIRIRFPRRAGLTLLSAAVVAACVVGALTGPPAGAFDRVQGTAQKPATGPDDLARFEAWFGPDGTLGDGSGAVDGVSARKTAKVALVAARIQDAPVEDFAVPRTVLDSYRRAASSLAVSDPSCHLQWWVLAGIGRIESGHAAGGRVDANGTTRGAILGPVLDGSMPGTAVIRDTDRGSLDGDTRFDRAVGPMQFVPATWASYASDGNHDGVASPDNVYDASLAAGRYLCSGSLDLATDAGLARAILRYNNSVDYLRSVLSWGLAYRDGTQSVLDSTSTVTPGSPHQPWSTVETPGMPPSLTSHPTTSTTTSRPATSTTSGPATSTSTTSTSSSSSSTSTTGTPTSSTSTSGSPTSSTSTTSEPSTSTSTTSSPTSTTCASDPSTTSTTSTSSTTSTDGPTTSCTSTTDPSGSPSGTTSPTSEPTSRTATRDRR
ncbi:lytic transglycosylase domain-containing protein [Oryzihumus leptocrescens]|uniref:Membrane-bound lytic murein transglycosylase B n=1 Tax=Oryzihumus leptocrescens TaxID=297536 RepID=A0A542ZGK5_9MICO|nr:lytic transglycosylase domain-containing protein [Oryzihumus leptocrescens]TQL59502.1 membrane-bound lytic murein transglycosylase B [Oryzihumus leptocrescens]